MIQQINLYQEVLKPRKVVLPFASIVLVSGIILLGMVAMVVFSGQRVERLADELARLELQRDGAQQRLVELQQKNQPRKPSKLLQQKITGLEADVSAQRRVLDQVVPMFKQQQQGFSAHLAGLARQHVSGTWYDNVTVAKSGRELVLVGAASKAELVPALVSRLSAEQVFSGAGFEVLNMQRNEDRVAFELRTSTGAVQ